MGRSHTEESKAKISATRKARYGTSDDAKKIKQRERYNRWVAQNPERAKEIKRKWTDRNREKLNAKQREKNATPERKEFMRKYSRVHRSSNREMYRTYTHNRRAAQAQAGAHTEQEWIDLVMQYEGKCAYCLKEKPLTRDHAIPLVRGGTNLISNILPACASCNSKKGSLTDVEYRARLAGLNVPLDDRWKNQLQIAQAKGRAARYSNAGR